MNTWAYMLLQSDLTPSEHPRSGPFHREENEASEDVGVGRGRETQARPGTLPCPCHVLEEEVRKPQAPVQKPEASPGW